MRVKFGSRTVILVLEAKHACGTGRGDVVMRNAVLYHAG